MDLTEKIKHLCIEKGITLASLERSCDLGNGTIRRWSTTIPAADRLQKVADYFGVTIDYLLGRIDTPYNKDSLKLEGTYLRLAKGAQELGLDEEDVDAILNLYKLHVEKNRR